MKKRRRGLYLADIKKKYKDRVYHTHLLRRSYREEGKVKQETLANLTELPAPLIEIIRQSLQGRVFIPAEEAIEINRSRAHGHVAAIKKMFEELGISELIASQHCRERRLVEAMIAARIINPQTKLATTRWWNNTTLAEAFDVADADEDELYEAMDWLLQRQSKIESKLAKRHLEEDSLILYDVSSSYYEGSHCILAVFGYNRDKKKGKRQIVYGIITDDQGRPIAIEVYKGSTRDSTTIEDQINKLKTSFGVEQFVLAGDRGMLTQAKIEKLRELGGIDWVSALRAPEIKQLIEKGDLQLSLFDEKDLLEITSDDYPQERLIVCRNPYLAQDRTRTRRELLDATQKSLERLKKRVASGRLKDPVKIGQALGRIANKYKVAKHFRFTVKEGLFEYQRNEERIAKEEAFDGFYILRTSVSKEKWEAEKVVVSYKSLSRVERIFRTLKGIDLRIRPIHHRIENRVRAHVFLCMLAYYVEWHLRQAWKSLLFDDEYPGEHENDSPVSPALRSESALKKSRTKKLDDGTAVHSFQTLLSELGTIVCNDAIIPSVPEMPSFSIYTRPNDTQRKALELVGLNTNLNNSRQKHRS